MRMNRQLRLRPPAGFVFVLAALLFFPSSSAFSQTQEPATQAPAEVEQLKKRLQQLEQTVVELKGQIDAIEAKKKSPTPEIVEATYTEPAKPVETASTEPAKPQNNNGKGESTFQVYGFAMLDAGYQFKQNHPDWFDVIRPTKLPSFPNEFAPNGKTYYGVRQSRFGVKSTTPTNYGELKTHFEFELFGTGVDAGQTTFRLRHAYGELGQFGAGQTWSPFMDIDVFPNSLEYWSPNGSMRGIAGIINDAGNVMGLMPHPERYLDWTRHPYWTRLDPAIRKGPTPGLPMFQNAVEAAKGVAIA